MKNMAEKKYYQAIQINEVKILLNKFFIYSPEIEEIDILNADNRTLAKDIIAPINVPHFNRSMRDGFAVKSEDTFSADEDSPIELKVVGKILAGEIPKIKLNKGECAQIATGAPLPEGADAVVMVEYINKLDDRSVEIFKAVSPGQYVIKIGNDIREGTILLKKNELLNPRDIGALAAIGKNMVPVYTKPKIALYSTGNEIIKLGEQLTDGKVYDINSYTLYHSIKRTGANISLKGILPDDIEIAMQSLKRDINNYDLIIMSGGTSKGIGDVFPSIIPQLGELEFLIHGIRIKPGKPTLFASLFHNNKRRMIALLPGYPTSALTIFNVFLKDRIMRWCKMPISKKKKVKAILTERVYSELGRHEFKSVKLIKRNDIFYAEPTKTGSDAITTLVGMDGFFEIPENVQILEEDEEVEVTIFD